MTRLFASALLGAALLLGCSGPRPAADLPAADAPASPPPEQIGDAPAPTPIDGVPTDGAATGTAPVDLPVTPASLYAGCKDRVEGVQVPGECVTDADCTKVGCSQEVCVPAKIASDVMTTCEVLPCFRALDTCGCHEGQCSWTVAAELPGNPGRVPLPTK